MSLEVVIRCPELLHAVGLFGCMLVLAAAVLATGSRKK